MATTAAAYDQNGLTFQSRRVSRAYDPPVVQHTSKGLVVRSDSDKSPTDPSSSSAIVDTLGRRFEAVGGLLAKAALGSMAAAGVLVSVVGKASLELASQLFGFMLLLVLTFLACTGSFYWWGGHSRGKVKLSVRKVTIIYLLCVGCEVLARLVGVFMNIPAGSSVPADTGYFISLTTLLFLAFSLLVHEGGLNAMFAQETVVFVVCTVVLNFSSISLFRDVLPHFILPQMVYAGLLLGLSVYLAGYRFPKISPSGIYWMFSENTPPRPVVTVEAVRPSRDSSSQQQSRRDSLSSTLSKQRASFSSVSSLSSVLPVS